MRDRAEKHRRGARWTSIATLILLAVTSCSEGKKVDEYPPEYSGVGVELEMRDGTPYVVRAFEPGPAHSAGVRSGDRIVAVDGAKTEGRNLGDVVMSLRGPTGSQVLVTVIGNGRTRPEIMAVKRGRLATDASAKPGEEKPHYRAN